MNERTPLRLQPAGSKAGTECISTEVHKDWLLIASKEESRQAQVKMANMQAASCNGTMTEVYDDGLRFKKAGRQKQAKDAGLLPSKTNLNLDVGLPTFACNPIPVLGWKTFSEREVTTGHSNWFKTFKHYLDLSSFAGLARKFGFTFFLYSCLK